MLEIPKPSTPCHIPDERNLQLHLYVNLKINQSPSLLAENNTCTIHCILVSSSLVVMWHLYVVAVCLVGVPTVEHINGLLKKAVFKHVVPFGTAEIC